MKYLKTFEEMNSEIEEADKKVEYYLKRQKKVERKMINIYYQP